MSDYQKGNLLLKITEYNYHHNIIVLCGLQSTFIYISIYTVIVKRHTGEGKDLFPSFSHDPVEVVRLYK